MPENPTGPEKQGFHSNDHGFAERQRQQIVWQDDPEIAERKARMLDRAKALKCLEAAQVLFACVNATDFFEKSSNIYLGPTEEDLAQRRHYKLSDPYDQAMRTVREQHEKFDLPGAKGSDWGRLIGALSAVTTPPEGVPSVFEVQAPEVGQGGEQWQRFSKWCQEQRLNAKGLAMLAQDIRVRLNLTESRAQSTVSSYLKTLSAANLDQLMMAGYPNIEALWVQSDVDLPQGAATYTPIYERLSDVISSRDEKKNNAFWADVERREQEVIMKHMRERRYDFYYDEREKHWRVPKGSSAARVLEDAQFTAKDIRIAAERQAEKEFNARSKVRIEKHSQAFEHPPRVALITRVGEIGGRKIATGVHPVSVKILKTIMPDQIKYDPPYLQFDEKAGQMVKVTPYSIGASAIRGGVTLSQEIEPATGEKVARAFGKILAADRSAELAKELPFIRDNEVLLGAAAEQLESRSGGRLKKPKDFDLVAWYGAKLVALGNLTSVADVKKHASSFVLTQADIYPGQEDFIRNLDGSYPNEITIQGQQYPVEYHFYKGDNISPAKFTASISVGSLDEEEVLRWPSALQVTVGPADAPIPVHFAGLNFDITSVSDLQEKHFLKYEIERKWEEYAGRGLQRPIEVNHEGELPDPASLLTTSLQPFMRLPNGEDKFPVPAIYVDRSFGAGPSKYILILWPTREGAEQRTAEARRAFEMEKVKFQREKAANPEVVSRARALVAEIKEALELKPGQFNPYPDYYRGSLMSLLNKGMVALEDKQADQALEALTQGKELLDAVNRCAEKFVQAVVLYERIKEISKGLWVGQPAAVPEFAGEYYQLDRDARYDHQKKQPPTEERLDETLVALHKREDILIARMLEAEDRRRAYAENKARWEKMTPEERRVEANKLQDEIRKIVSDFTAQLTKARPFYNFYRAPIDEMRRRFNDGHAKRATRRQNSDSPASMSDLEQLNFDLEYLAEDIPKLEKQLHKYTTGQD